MMIAGLDASPPDATATMAKGAGPATLVGPDFSALLTLQFASPDGTGPAALDRAATVAQGEAAIPPDDGDGDTVDDMGPLGLTMPALPPLPAPSLIAVLADGLPPVPGKPASPVAAAASGTHDILIAGFDGLASVPAMPMTVKLAGISAAKLPDGPDLPVSNAATERHVTPALPLPPQSTAGLDPARMAAAAPDAPSVPPEMADILQLAPSSPPEPEHAQSAVVLPLLRDAQSPAVPPLPVQAPPSGHTAPITPPPEAVADALAPRSALPAPAAAQRKARSADVEPLSLATAPLPAPPNIANLRSVAVVAGAAGSARLDQPIPQALVTTRQLGQIGVGIGGGFGATTDRLQVHFTVDRPDIGQTLVAASTGLDQGLAASGNRLEQVLVHLRSSALVSPSYLADAAAAPSDNPGQGADSAGAGANANGNPAGNTADHQPPRAVPTPAPRAVLSGRRTEAVPRPSRDRFA